MRSRPTIGLALSGGGARGLAHVGALRALEAAGLPPDFLAGTSMGGIIGAAYAAGRGPEELQKASASLSKLSSWVGLADLRLPRAGLFTGSVVKSTLAGLLEPHRSFETLRLPLALTAVDLRSAELVVLDSGDLLSAVNATMAVPGLFEPVELGDRSLVDGGVLSNLPIEVARQMGADVIVAVDVSQSPSDDETWRQIRLPQIGTQIWRTLSIMIAQQTEAKLGQAGPIVLVRPAIPGGITTISGFRRVDDVIAAGERAMQAALPRLRQLLASPLQTE